MTRPVKAFRLRRLDIAKVVSLGLAQVATLLAFLVLTAQVVNALTVDAVGAAAVANDHRTMLELGGLVCLAFLHGWLLNAEFSVSEKVGYNVVRDLRMQMYDHLLGMTGHELLHRARGGLLLRFIGDLSMLRMWISRGLLGGSVAAIVVVGTLVPLAIVDPWIGISMAAVLSCGAAISLTNGKRMRSATRTMRRRRSLVTGVIDEQINALEVVQVSGRAPGEHSRLSRQNVMLNRSLCRVAELRGRLRGIADGTGLLTLVAVLAVGLVEVRRGYATVGLVVAAVSATRLLDGPVRTLGLAHDYWHRAQVSQGKILDFLRSSSRGLAPPGLERLTVRRGTIEFRDVTMDGALDSVALTARAGELVAVTGGAGAGKSSMLRLVARLVEPDSGEILIDQQPLSETTPASLFRHIGMVSPDLLLMRGTVRRNLTYGAPSAGEEEIQRVILTTGLDDVLADLPDGLDTWLIEGGRNLSSAQRQRVGLARALLANPTILLLDQPTAGLDDDSKTAFLRVVARHQGTVLLVTHDPAELMMADQVWVLDHGRVTAALSGDEYERQWLRAQKEDRLWHRPTAS
jgi:ATP-binding cassette subfamily B protein